MPYLTTHFSLEELTVTQHRGIDNTPSPEIVQNLTLLARSLEEVRKLLKKPILITSGFRSNILNTLIGGAKNSKHKYGLAADFICPGFGPPKDVCLAIAESTIPFDQLIHEYGRWVHFGLSSNGNLPMREVMSIRSAKEGYKLGIE